MPQASSRGTRPPRVAVYDSECDDLIPKIKLTEIITLIFQINRTFIVISDIILILLNMSKYVLFKIKFTVGLCISEYQYCSLSQFRHKVSRMILLLITLCVSNRESLHAKFIQYLSVSDNCRRNLASNSDIRRSRTTASKSPLYT